MLRLRPAQRIYAFSIVNLQCKELKVKQRLRQCALLTTLPFTTAHRRLSQLCNEKTHRHHITPAHLVWNPAKVGERPHKYAKQEVFRWHIIHVNPPWLASDHIPRTMICLWKLSALVTRIKAGADFFFFFLPPPYVEGGLIHIVDLYHFPGREGRGRGRLLTTPYHGHFVCGQHGIILPVSEKKTKALCTISLFLTPQERVNVTHQAWGKSQWALSLSLRINNKQCLGYCYIVTTCPPSSSPWHHCNLIKLWRCDWFRLNVNRSICRVWIVSWTKVGRTVGAIVWLSHKSRFVFVWYEFKMAHCLFFQAAEGEGERGGGRIVQTGGTLPSHPITIRLFAIAKLLTPESCGYASASIIFFAFFFFFFFFLQSLKIEEEKTPLCNQTSWN